MKQPEKEETKAPRDDFIPTGIFGPDGEEIYRIKEKIKVGFWPK